MFTPSILCAALLGLAQPAFSRPVVESIAESYLTTTKSSIEKRAPQGPKIGGADFPGTTVEKEAEHTRSKAYIAP